jgi:acetylornithine deacetylase/succinyl-diaminopimelate desuccinylase-like protein
MFNSEKINQYIDNNQSVFIDQLKEWLTIPSISTLSEHTDDVLAAANWAKDTLSDIGFSDPYLIETDGHPLVYGEWITDETQPTLLCYGHYDVQPVDPIDEWDSAPFDPVIRSDKIYCRGASDDKGNAFIVLAAIKSWVATHGAPPVNLKILLEGEEEAGGASIEIFVKENGATLSADAVLICDTHMISEMQPSLITSLRGILYTEILMQGAKTDLHSGSYGGVAPNPIHDLCLLLARLKGADGAIQIEEFEKPSPHISNEEKQFWHDDPLKLTNSLCEEMGVSSLTGEDNYPALERLGVRPTLEVHGIRGGFTGEGAKTVIPAKGLAKVSLRLPPWLVPDDVFTWFEKAVKQLAPGNCHVEVTNLHSGRGVYVDPDNVYIKAAADSLESVYGKAPVFMREGGSIPVAALFDEVLGTPVVLMGFGLPEDTIHAPNENFSLRQFHKGIKTVASFMGRIQKKS